MSISHRCHLFELAFVWELTGHTIHLPLGCLQGGELNAVKAGLDARQGCEARLSLPQGHSWTLWYTTTIRPSIP